MGYIPQLGTHPQNAAMPSVRLDLTDRLSVEQAFDAALAEASYFDVVINNAGAGHFDAAEFLPMETIASQFQFWFSVKSN